mmetsp:Transcript_2040/g.7388  ORF Transcript_2040/g.7388 Transcript_2040/m.7388 type:complete len:251 (-) Transcript_2040:56-808(-)
MAAFLAPSSPESDAMMYDLASPVDDPANLAAAPFLMEDLCGDGAFFAPAAAAPSGSDRPLFNLGPAASVPLNFGGADGSSFCISDAFPRMDAEHQGSVEMRVLRRKHRFGSPEQQHTESLARIYSQTYIDITTHNLQPGTRFALRVDRRVDHMRADYRCRAYSQITIQHEGADHGVDLDLELPCNGTIRLVLLPVSQPSRGRQRPRFHFGVSLNERTIHELCWVSEVFSPTAPGRRGRQLPPPNVLSVRV